MKIIFMDVDGVLNSRAWWHSIPEAERDERFASNDHYDPKAVERFNGLVERTGAKIVVSSSWRKLFKWKELMEIFSRNGLRIDCIDRTPTKMSYRPRGAEIEEWLVDNMEELGVTSIAIVDDDSDMIHMTPWFVRTTYTHGLQDKHVTEIETLLAKPFTRKDLDNAWREGRYDDEDDEDDDE